MLGDVLQFVINAGSGTSLLRLRQKFPTVAPAVRACLERGYLELRGSCYHATARGREFMSEEAAAAATANALKRCRVCRIDKPRDQFWKDSWRSDGLYQYCIDCCNRRKAQMREARQLEARTALRNAAELVVAAAARWDHGVAELAAAWADIMAADETLRINRRAAGVDNDSGRMEARLLHAHAMFGLSIALIDARFPIGWPVLREAPLSPRLAAYVGSDPVSDYLSAAVEPQIQPSPTAERRKRRR